MISTIALQQFQIRQRKSEERRNEGLWPQAEAEMRLRPWAAAAVLCVELADLRRVHPDYPAAYESRRKAGQSYSLARHMMAMELCDITDMRQVIADARDAAIRAAHASSADLATLSIHLHCPPHVPEDMKEELEQAA